VRVIGKELLPLTSVSVVHANTRRLPRGAKAFKADDYVRSVAGSPLILSRFRNPATPTERHLLVANYSSANKATSRLRLSGAVREVFEISRTSGRRVPIELIAAESCGSRSSQEGQGYTFCALDRYGVATGSWGRVGALGRGGPKHEREPLALYSSPVHPSTATTRTCLGRCSRKFHCPREKMSAATITGLSRT
jgi:hypothetical protein